jgi:flagellar biosynthetic protein FliR
MDQLTNFVFAILLVTLRLGPTMAFAPPFTLLRVPVTIRILLAISLSIWLIAARPEVTVERVGSDGFLVLVAGELLVGIAIALGLQLTFAAMLWVGGAVDIQAGFGLALLADPTTNAQIPLAGTILAFAAGAIFFTTGAHYDLLALWAASFDTLPVGYDAVALDVAAVAGFMSTLFLLAMGLVGIAMLTIFLADMVIAFLSRTLPQMNVLLLGFQVKTMLMLITLPLSLTFGFGLFLRLLRMAVTGPAGFWGGAS